MGLQKNEMGFHWDYRKVVGITYRVLPKKRAQSCLGFHRHTIGILKKAFWDYIGITEINSWVSWDSFGITEK